jgi:hypothetical protein
MTWDTLPKNRIRIAGSSTTVDAEPIVIDLLALAIGGYVIASNKSFAGWTMTFTDPRLCAAIVDRLSFGGKIIETGPPGLLPRPQPFACSRHFLARPGSLSGRSTRLGARSASVRAQPGSLQIKREDRVAGRRVGGLA